MPEAIDWSVFAAEDSSTVDKVVGGELLKGMSDKSACLIELSAPDEALTESPFFAGCIVTKPKQKIRVIARGTARTNR